MKYPIKYNQSLSNDKYICFTCFNFELGEDFAFIFYDIDSHNISEVVLFSESENDIYPYYFFREFDFDELIYESVDYPKIYYLNSGYVSDICKIIYMKQFKKQFKNLAFAFEYDKFTLLYKYQNYVIFLQLNNTNIFIRDGDNLMNPMCLFNIKLNIKKLILLAENQILMNNLLIINKFNPYASAINYFDVMALNKYLHKFEIPDFSNRISISKEIEIEIEKLFKMYLKLCDKRDLNGRTNFKFIKVSLHPLTIKISAFGIQIYECQPNCFYGYDIFSNSKLKYIFNFIITHPDYFKYLTKLEMLILK